MSATALSHHRSSLQEIKRGDYLLDHSIISYLIDPDGEFADYYGKSLSEDEMFTRCACILEDHGSYTRRPRTDALATLLHSSGVSGGSFTTFRLPFDL